MIYSMMKIFIDRWRKYLKDIVRQIFSYRVKSFSKRQILIFYKENINQHQMLATTSEFLGRGFMDVSSLILI